MPNLIKDQIEVDVIHQHTLENELRQAEMRGEFRLVYQPTIDAKTDKIAGSEALIRWDHPKRGTVPPDDFIQIAEQTKLIISIGDWVIEEVCKKIRFWLDYGQESS